MCVYVCVVPSNISQFLYFYTSDGKEYGFCGYKKIGKYVLTFLYRTQA